MGKTPASLKAQITRLEMTAPPKASMTVPVNIQTAIMRAPEIPLPFYRYLYRQVGARWQWVDRMRMSDEQLAETLNDKR
ncbi:GNAT family N-acetyltransferase, partial [Rhizobium leguminosarum]